MSAHWSPNIIADLEQNSQFIYVAPDHLRRISINEAKNFWESSPETIFHTGYRIAGLPSLVSNELLNHNVSIETIGEIYNTSLYYDNFFSNPDYFTELDRYQKLQQSKIKTNISSSGLNLTQLIVLANPERLSIKKKELRSRSPKTVSIIDKIINLPDNKVLDVSNITPSGTGARTIAPPSGRSKKYGSHNLKIVSSNFDSYLLAVDLIPDGRIIYDDDIKYVAALFGINYQSQEPENII